MAKTHAYILIFLALAIYAFGFAFGGVSTSNFKIWLALPTIILIGGLIGLLQK